MTSIPRHFGPAIALFLLALPVLAHHSRSIFDRERVITVEGVVTKYEWTNPHVTVFVEAETDAGDTVVWEFESGATTYMRGRGWTSDMLTPGDHVVVDAHPLRAAGATTADTISIRKADVMVVDNGVTPAALARSESDAVATDSLAGVWYVPQNPANRKFASYPTSPWSLTTEGAEALAAYDDRTMNPQNQCGARTAPWLMTWGIYSIEVSDSSISIRTEYDTVERTVHMDVSSHDGAELSNHGHSIGHWDGETLVVDTTHFANNRTGNARGIPSGPEKHLVERFDLNPDGTGLTYRFNLEDPEYLSAAAAGELQATYRPDLGFEPIKCDLGVAGRFLED